MRTIIFFLCLCLCLGSSLPARADPSARSEAEKLGFSPEVLKSLPDRHLPRAPNPDAPVRSRPITRDGAAPDTGLLSPRQYQKAESVSMVPYLLALHKKSPRSPKITRKLALTCLKAGQPREALYWFVQTWFRDRTDFPALWNCAALSYRLGDYRGASAYLKEYAQRDPNSAWGRIAREFQNAGPYSSGDLAAGFAGRLPRGGVLAGGAPAKGGSSLMIIGGKEMPLPEGDSFADRLDEGPAPTGSGKGKKAATEASQPLPAKAPLNRAFIEPPATREAAPPPAPAPTAAPASAPAPAAPAAAPTSGPTTAAPAPVAPAKAAPPAAAPVPAAAPMPAAASPTARP